MYGGDSEALLFLNLTFLNQEMLLKIARAFWLRQAVTHLNRFKT